MEFEDVLRENKRIPKEKKNRCSNGHKNLGEIRVIFKRCLDCGKLVPVRDEEYIKKHGEPGQAPDYTN